MEMINGLPSTPARWAPEGEDAISSAVSCGGCTREQPSAPPSPSREASHTDEDEEPEICGASHQRGLGRASAGSNSPPPLCGGSDAGEDNDANSIPDDECLTGPPPTFAELNRPCPHNQWVKYGKKQGKIVLRCTDESCKRQWKIRPGIHAKCVDFYKNGCSRGTNCPHPHIYARQGYLRTSTVPTDGLARRTDWPPHPPTDGTAPTSTPPCASPAAVSQSGEDSAVSPIMSPQLQAEAINPIQAYIMARMMHTQRANEASSSCGLSNVSGTFVGHSLSSPPLSPPTSPQTNFSLLPGAVSPRDPSGRPVPGFPTLDAAKVAAMQRHHKTQPEAVPSWLGDMLTAVSGATAPQVKKSSGMRSPPPTTITGRENKRLNAAATEWRPPAAAQPIGNQRGLNASAAAFVPGCHN